jgi:hypothetical protein
LPALTRSLEDAFIVHSHRGAETAPVDPAHREHRAGAFPDVVNGRGPSSDRHHGFLMVWTHLSVQSVIRSPVQ